MNAPAAVKFLVIINYGGIERELEVNPHEAVQAVLERAMNLSDITSNRHTLALFDASNRELTDLAQSAEDAGITKGSKLVLRQSQVRGG
jgi:hypothetical protein